jgi:capsular polysaccharide biosynthesis protein
MRSSVHNMCKQDVQESLVVFRSFVRSDRELAGEVAEQVQRSGLSVVRMSDLNPAGD